MMSPSLLAFRELAVFATDSLDEVLEIILIGGARRGREDCVTGFGEPSLGICAAIILLGCGLSWRTGIFRNSSDFRAACRLLVVYVGGALEGCRLRIGAIGTGGVGSSIEDLRRAGASSSSKTVSCVRALKGRNGTLGCSRSPAGRFCSAATLSKLFTATEVPSNSALIATPI